MAFQVFYKTRSMKKYKIFLARKFRTRTLALFFITRFKNKNKKAIKKTTARFKITTAKIKRTKKKIRRATKRKIKRGVRQRK